MAVVYSTVVKNARLQVVVDAIGSGGKLVIGTSALSGATGVLATIPLNNPAATVSNGVMTLAGLPIDATATANGQAALAEFRDSGNTVIISGLTVGLAGSGPGGSDPNIVIGAVDVSVGQTVQITAGTITHG